ncbi:MAG: pilus assembly protein PilM [Planctomycetota bacterium]|jgi:Tfp pilus assembly PilM family ATPase
MITLKRPRIGKSLVALDVGFTGMRAAQLRISGDQWIIDSTSRYDIPVDQPNDGQAETWRRGMARCFEQAQFAGRRVVLGVSPPDISFYPLEVPDALLTNEGPETETVIREEIRRMLSTNESDVNTTHWALPPPSVSAPNALGVAAPSNMINNAIAACRLARLDCVTMDASATALCRYGYLLNDFDKGRIWGVLDVGHRQSRLTLCLGGTPVLTRAIGDGSQQWTKLIAEELGTTTKTAEIQKCEHGIAATKRRRDDDAGANQSSDVASMIFGIIRASLTTIATEINRSYEYALSCYGQRSAGDLILVGGGVALKQLPKFLSDALGITVRRSHEYIGGPRCRLSCDSRPTGEIDRMATALGLAVSG